MTRTKVDENAKTALFSEHGFWIPKRLMQNRQAQLIEWNSITSTSQRLGYRIKDTLQRWRIKKRRKGPFELWPVELIVYFLQHIAGTGDIDTLRTLLVAFEPLKSLVLLVRDELAPSKTPLLPRIHLFCVNQTTTLSWFQFTQLLPGCELLRRPIRIFVIQNCGIGSTQPNINFSSTKRCQLLPYLTSNTPLIIRTFGHRTQAHDEIVSWAEQTQIGFPLIITKASSWRYFNLDLTLCPGPPKTREERAKADYRIPFDDNQYQALRRFRNPADFGRLVSFESILELYSIPDYGELLRPDSPPNMQLRFPWTAPVVVLGFRGGCVSHGDNVGECFAPRFEICHRAAITSFHYMERTCKPFELLKIVFEGPRVPDVELYDPSGVSSVATRPKRLCLVNKMWSEEKPFGQTCNHAIERGQDASQWCCYNPTGEPRIRIASGIYGPDNFIQEVDFVGLPDSVFHILELRYTKKLTWKRLSPTTHSLLCEDLYFDRLRQLDLYSLIRKGESLPTFFCSKLEELTLVALSGSTGSWDLPKILGYKTMKSLRKLILTCPQTCGAELDASDLRYVAGAVEDLSVTGYVPQFALCSTSGSLQFPRIQRLRIDISQVQDCSRSLTLHFPGERFSSLHELALTVSPKFAEMFRVHSSEGIELGIVLPRSAASIAIDALIPIRNLVVNDEKYVFREPRTPLYFGTTKIWRRESKEPGARFIYRGEVTSFDPLNQYYE